MIFSLPIDSCVTAILIVLHDCIRVIVYYKSIISILIRVCIVISVIKNTSPIHV